jgi:hypothetical protein
MNAPLRCFVLALFAVQRRWCVLGQGFSRYTFHFTPWFVRSIFSLTKAEFHIATPLRLPSLARHQVVLVQSYWEPWPMPKKPRVSYLIFFFLFCCCLRLARPIGLSLAFHQFCCTSIWGLRFRSSTKLSFAFFLARSYLSWSDLIMHIKSPLVAFGIVLVLLSQASALYPEDSNILTELYKFYKAYSPSYVLGWSIPPTCSWTGVTCDGSNDRVTGSSTMALL